MDDSPLVSIGMPVYNEGRFIKDSLEALVNQDYTNIELIISDNASNDDTGKICHQYAEQYGWIQCHKSNVNKGPASNAKFVLEKASGKYFMWAAGHDLWSKNFISESVKLLESYQEAAVVVATTNWIDEDGMPYVRESGWTDTRGMDIIARYFTVLWGNMHPILGLIRRGYIINSPPKGVVGSDLILLSGLALKGDFLHASNVSWSRREFRVEKSYADKLERYKSKEYGLATGGINKYFPLIHLPVELIKEVLSANISWGKRFLILFLLLPTLPVRYFSGTRKK